MKLDRLFCPRDLAFSLVIFCLAAADNASMTQQRREIKAIGCFANVRSDGERAYGYSVQLWAWGRNIIRLIAYHKNLPGHPPLGVLTEVQYDPFTGKISFEAKLTTGLHRCSEHKGIPSQDLLSFQGFLKTDSLEGSSILKD